jgi:hypothetical protein
VLHSVNIPYEIGAFIGVADFWDENNFAYIQNPGRNVPAERLYNQKTSRTYATPIYFLVFSNISIIDKN